MRNESRTGERLFWTLCLCVCAGILSWWFFSSEMLWRHDMYFHLNRIEGIREGLLAGQLPVRIHAYQLNGYGFPVGIFYPDAFLYVPALLRMVGVSLTQVYNLLGVGLVFMTMGLAWYGFSLWTGSLRKGAVSAVCYCSFYFYLFDTYFGGAIGSVAALAFYPLAFAAVLGVLTGPVDHCRRRWPLAVVAFTGVLQSHVINSLLLTLGVLFACAVHYRAFFVQERRCSAIKALGFTLLLNAWFLVPFGYFYQHMDFWIKSTVHGSLATMTSSFADLAAVQFWWGWPMLLLSVAAFWGLGKSNRSYGLLKVFGIGVFLVVLSWDIFPWEWVEKISWVGAYAMKLQFPQRFLPLAAICFSLFSGDTIVSWIEQRRFSIGWLGVVCFFTCIWNMYFMQNFSVNVGGQYLAWSPKYFSLGQLPSYGVYEEDYLYRGVVFSALRNHEGMVPTAKDFYPADIFDQIKKQGTTIDFSYAVAKDTTAQLPLFYYPGYAAKREDGREIHLHETAEHILLADLPAGEGTVQVAYRGLPVFRAADAVSVASVVALGILVSREMIR